MTRLLFNQVGTNRFWYVGRWLGDQAVCHEFLPETEWEPGEWSGRTAGTAILPSEDLDPTGMTALLG